MASILTHPRHIDKCRNGVICVSTNRTDHVPIDVIFAVEERKAGRVYGQIHFESCKSCLV